ncbi:hypothetical protein JCM3766R1_004266 [Sporobolomyces carnicolor]
MEPPVRSYAQTYSAMRGMAARISDKRPSAREPNAVDIRKFLLSITPQDWTTLEEWPVHNRTKYAERIMSHLERWTAPPLAAGIRPRNPHDFYQPVENLYHELVEDKVLTRIRFSKWSDTFKTSTNAPLPALRRALSEVRLGAYQALVRHKSPQDGWNQATFVALWDFWGRVLGLDPGLLYYLYPDSDGEEEEEVHTDSE